MTRELREQVRQSRRIVIKVGTAVVTRADGGLSLGRLGSLVEQIRALRDEKRQVLLVSSGAVGLGADTLGLGKTTLRLADRQACAAAGQGALVGVYNDLLKHMGLAGAQVLLTEADFSDRTRYVNLQHTLERLLDLGVVPIINENDTVSTSELVMDEAHVFGDNDRLSALLASRLEADLLLLLTDVDGVYTAPPEEEGAERVDVFSSDLDIAIGDQSAMGRGGMASKIAAARIATTAGITVVIANGLASDTVSRIVAGESVGTIFAPERVMNSRKRWLTFATAARGRIIVNAGAREALVDGKASLLPRGVVAVEGEFVAGEVVAISSEDGAIIARGICNCSSTEARSIMGRHTRELGDTRSDRSLVHRENLAILKELAG